jgi:3-isopropylmalate/(R)-2-methylmalate dehydratase large subunit
VPATPEIVRDLQTTYWGNQTIWDVLVSAGVQMTENAGCAACLGGPVDTFGRINKAGIKCISATNRNFPGRMGDKESAGVSRLADDRGRERDCRDRGRL